MNKKLRKKCGKCRKERELEDFHIAKKGECGRQWACKKCVSKERKSHRLFMSRPTGKTSIRGMDRWF
ncbi:hypothetical protein LCGC14_0820400 [marine sediment metagenome]|uniref:Uncharacterized protein n=1 Tax=marine sediment metagenome TaxID=412755 RepID=A0A0F9Q4A7_9ZZZZ